MQILDDFLIRAGLAGLGLALAAGPLGCFIVWRRMAYFGDATAHAAILGVSLSLAFSMSVVVGVLAVALAMGAIVSRLGGRTHSIDTLLGVLSHGALAIGLFTVSLMTDVRIDLMAYLFGDILTVDRLDVAIIWIGSAVVVAAIWWRWTALLTATFSTDLASATGFAPRRDQLVLTLALAVVVAVSIKVVGALLISAMLIIPAAAARPLSDTPERMAGLAALIGCLAVVAGLAGSFHFDTPAGPTIASAAALVFVLALGLSRLTRP